MKGDAFAHVMPRAFSGEFEKEAAKIGTTALFWPIDDLADLDRRVEVMDEFGIDQQVLALGSVPIVDVIPDSTVAARLARLANDSLAEMIADYPGRFLPVGTIAMDDMESGLTEAEHCLQDLGMLGIQIYSNARGRAIDHPEFFPLYAMAAEAGKPLWLHPARALSRADYVDEPSSYHSMAFVLGWPYETTQAMTRLVFAGIFEQLPELKIIVHHAGAMVPLLARRIETAYNQEHTADHTYTIMTTGEKAPLQRPVIDYFRMFYTCLLYTSHSKETMRGTQS